MTRLRLVLITIILFSHSAWGAPQRIACTSQTGEFSARYWSEQAKKNRAFGQPQKANQMEQTAAFCETSKFGRKAVITFDGELPEGNQEITAEFQLFTLCGKEGGDIIAAKLSLDQKTFSVSYYHPAYRTMRYFQVDRASLKAGFIDQRDFRCEIESFDLSDRMF